MQGTATMTALRAWVLRHWWHVAIALVVLLVAVPWLLPTVYITNADRERTIPVAIGSRVTIALRGETPDGLSYEDLDFEGWTTEGGGVVCTSGTVPGSLSISCRAVSPGIVRVYPKFHDLTRPGSFPGTGGSVAPPEPWSVWVLIL